MFAVRRNTRSTVVQLVALFILGMVPATISQPVLAQYAAFSLRSRNNQLTPPPYQSSLEQVKIFCAGFKGCVVVSNSGALSKAQVKNIRKATKLKHTKLPDRSIFEKKKPKK